MYFCHCMLVTVLLILQPDLNELCRISDRPSVPSKPDTPSSHCPTSCKGTVQGAQKEILGWKKTVHKYICVILHCSVRTLGSHAFSSQYKTIVWKQKNWVWRWSAVAWYKRLVETQGRKITMNVPSCCFKQARERWGGWISTQSGCGAACVLLTSFSFILSETAMHCLMAYIRQN